MLAFFKRHFSTLLYAMLSFAILGPLLRPGYILTLDMPFGPNMNLVTRFYGLSLNVEAVIRLPFSIVLWGLSRVIAPWLVQKILLLSILSLAGIGAHRLLTYKGVAPYFAGLLYTVNPFTYVRFLAGQWPVLAVYALTPFAIKAFLELIEKQKQGNIFKVVLLTTLVGIMYEHGFIILFIAYIIFATGKILMMPEKKEALKLLSCLGITAVIFVVLNAYWLIPLATASATALQQVGEMDLTGFAPHLRSSLGILFEVASMHGFWRGGYEYASDFIPGWWLLYAFILFLAVYGFLSYRRDKENGGTVVSLAILAVVGLLLAAGASNELTGPVFEWLWRNAPIFKVFRDSQKFVALLCLSYAYLGSLGVYEVNRVLKGLRRGSLQRILVSTLILLSFVIPPVYSFTMFGFYGKLGVTDYPEAWYEANKYLNRDRDDFNTLFLPWHNYMNYEWLPNKDKRLSTPARFFFDKPVIQGDNIEMPGTYSQSTNPISRYIEFLLNKKNEISNFGELVTPLNVKYIILVCEADWEAYDFIFQQQDLRLVIQEPGLFVFQNEHHVSRAYGVNDVVFIKDWSDYLVLSKEQNVTDYLYLLEDEDTGLSGEEVLSPDSAVIDNIRCRQLTPVSFRIEKNDAKYFVFTLPQNFDSRNWEYGGIEPVYNLGITPAFLSGEGDSEIVYRRFYFNYLPGYAISLITFIFIILSWLKKR